jgi:hypothetical protein
MGWGNGESPIADDNPFSFISMVFYPYWGWDRTNLKLLPDQPGKFRTVLATEFETRIGRFRRLYPTTTLVVGEMGYSTCHLNPGQDTIQAQVIGSLLAEAKNKSMGFNIWGFPAPRGVKNDILGSCVEDYGYGITKADGSGRSSACVISDIIAGGEFNPEQLPENCDLLERTYFPDALPNSCRLPRAIIGGGVDVTQNSFRALWELSPIEERYRFDRLLIRVSENLFEVATGCGTGSNCVVKDDSVPLGAINYPVSNLKPNTQYYVRVVALCNYKTPIQVFTEGVFQIKTQR